MLRAARCAAAAVRIPFRVPGPRARLRNREANSDKRDQVWLPCRISRLSNPQLQPEQREQVWLPYRTSVFLFQRPRTGFPVRCGSPQALIPVPTTVQFALARSPYDTAMVANETNGGTRIQKRGSCRGESLRLPPREKAFAFHPFDRRCDSSDCATEDSFYVYLYTFGCRVESAGSPTRPSISN